MITCCNRRTLIETTNWWRLRRPNNFFPSVTIVQFVRTVRTQPCTWYTKDLHQFIAHFSKIHPLCVQFNSRSLTQFNKCILLVPVFNVSKVDLPATKTILLVASFVSAHKLTYIPTHLASYLLFYVWLTSYLIQRYTNITSYKILQLHRTKTIVNFIKVESKSI